MHNDILEMFLFANEYLGYFNTPCSFHFQVNFGTNFKTIDSVSNMNDEHLSKCHQSPLFYTKSS